MRHDAAIRTLRELVEGSGRPSDAAAADAERHIGSCSDCWEAFDALYERLVGVRLVAPEDFDPGFRCAEVREQLDRFVDLPPDAMQRDYPVAARHLGWCEPCRERLAALIELEATAPFPAVVPARVPAAARLARLLVRLRDDLVELVEVSASFVPVSWPEPAPVRGPSPEHDSARTRLRVSFQEGGVAGEIDVVADGERTARLTIRFQDAIKRSIRLRDQAGSRVASEIVGSGGEAVFRLVPLGRYFVELVTDDTIASFELDLRGPERVA